MARYPSPVFCLGTHGFIHESGPDGDASAVCPAGRTVINAPPAGELDSGRQKTLKI
jgi:hypothetical protein